MKDVASKIKTSIRSTIAEVEQKIRDLYTAIVSNKSFKEVVAFARKQMVAIEQFTKQQMEYLKQQIEILKKNPTFMSMKKYITTVVNDMSIGLGKAMEMVRKEVSALRSKINSYVATIKKQVKALVGELKVRMKSVVEYLKYLIKYIPGKSYVRGINLKIS